LAFCGALSHSGESATLARRSTLRARPLQAQDIKWELGRFLLSGQGTTLPQLKERLEKFEQGKKGLFGSVRTLGKSESSLKDKAEDVRRSLVKAGCVPVALHCRVAGRQQLLASDSYYSLKIVAEEEVRLLRIRGHGATSPQPLSTPN